MVLVPLTRAQERLYEKKFNKFMQLLKDRDRIGSASDEKNDEHDDEHDDEIDDERRIVTSYAGSDTTRRYLAQSFFSLLHDFSRIVTQGEQEGSKDIESHSPDSLASCSGKFQFVVSLLSRLNDTREKVLIFSQHIQPLYQLQQIIMCISGYADSSYVLTGQVPIYEREEMIRSFTDGDTRVLFLTKSVGGVGLNLIAATRVILLDVHWNPSRMCIYLFYASSNSKGAYILVTL